MAISSATELESSLISFAGSDSTLTRQGVDKRKGRRPEGWGGGGRLFKGRDYFEKFPSKGAIIRGNTVSMNFHLPVYEASTEKKVLSQFNITGSTTVPS